MVVTKVKINPAMMKWAREYAGFINGYEETLPKNIKSKYEYWENGEIYPTWNQLREVSKKYKVPTAFFFMTNPPSYGDVPNLINYRKIETNLIFETMSPNLISNIRKSQFRREIYLELLEKRNEEIKLFKTFDKSLDKYVFSKHIRQSLDIPLDTQKSWFEGNSKDYGHYRFLNNWKSLLNEKYGILIFETYDVDIKEMRGLCIFYEKCPIILLNGKDSVKGRIFSLFHELTHLLLGQSAICDDNEDGFAEEIFCNSVAREFLVPTIDLKENFEIEKNSNNL